MEKPLEKTLRREAVKQVIRACSELVMLEEGVDSLLLLCASFKESSAVETKPKLDAASFPRRERWADLSSDEGQ